MTRKYDVTGIGNAIVDIIAKVEDGFLTEHNLTKGSMALIDESGVKILSELKYEKVRSGGSVSNSIAALAMMGLKTSIIGKVGSDKFGKIFNDDLKKINCDFHCKHKEHGEVTARSFILVAPDGERTMCTFLGQASNIQSEIDEKIIADSNILYLEGYLWDQPETIASLREAISIANENDVKVAFTLSDSFCVQRHREDFLEIINSVDILFANESEMKILIGQEDLTLNHYQKIKDLSINHPNLVIALTRSENGSTIIDHHKNVHEVATLPVEKITDTTGAGDAFAAGFLYGLTQNFDLEKSAKIGNALARTIIQKLGARFEDSEIEEIKKGF